MKRAIGLIVVTLLTTSIYSQDYSSSSTSNPDSTPDYRSRQTESGAPPSSDTSSSAGYDRAPGLSGGNSPTGQSNGSNIGSPPSEDQSLTTRDSDLPGSEYRGTLKRQPDQTQNPENSNVGSSGSSTSGSSSSDETTVKGSNSADGAFHEPAAPAREGSQSEGWSSSGTFSGAGPGAVSGSESSQSSDSSNSSSIYGPTAVPTEPSEDLNPEVNLDAALNQRDEDLSNRGLEPDSSQLSQDENSKMQNQEQPDEVLIFEDSQVVRPDENIGAPGTSESGVGNSSDEQYLGNPDHFDSTQHDQSMRKDNSGSAGMSTSGSSSSADDAYAKDLYRRTQKDWSARLRTDVPHTIPNIMDRTVDELTNTRYYNESSQSEESVGAIGAPGSSVSGSQSSKDSNCDHNKGSAAEFEHGYREGSDDLDGSVRGIGTQQSAEQPSQQSSGAPGASVSGGATSSDQGKSLKNDEGDRYHINRGTDDKYHINREASGDRSEEMTAPSEYGDRPTTENYDDGHLNGNNAAGNSESYESSSSGSDISRPDRFKSSPGQPQGGDENSATTPE